MLVLSHLLEKVENSRVGEIYTLMFQRTAAGLCSSAAMSPSPALTPVVTSSSAAAATAAAGSSQSSPLSTQRFVNRIIMLCTALNKHKDTPSWPLWKWQQMKATKGVTDFVMMAITCQDSFIARIDGAECFYRPLKADIRTVDRKFLSNFLDEWHAPGRTFLVYGGHGVADFLEFETGKQALQGHELASLLGTKSYLGILFDACLMANLDTAYYLRKNTRYIGAAEGYMWEEDTWHPNHIFNAFAASVMSRFKTPAKIFRLVQEEYVRKSQRADFSLIDTDKVSELFDFVYSDSMLRHIYGSVRIKKITGASTPSASVTTLSSAEKKNTHPTAKKSTEPPGDGTETSPTEKAATLGDVSEPEELETSEEALDAFLQRSKAADWSLSANRHHFVFPFSLCPNEAEDNHIVDLFHCVEHDPEGVRLFHQVVLSHSPPSDGSLYDTTLRGLNFTLGIFNRESKPLPVTRPPFDVVEWIVKQQKLQTGKKAVENHRGASGEADARDDTPPLSSPD